jgi:RNA polymerase sigma-70 factor (ECF subfamily)
MEPVGRSLDFASVYAEHAPYVRKLLVRRGVRSEDVDDVLQEAFVTIHRLLPSFEGRASLETWLGSVVWRVAAGYHRRRKRIGPSSAEAIDGGIADRPALQVADEGLHASLAMMDEESRDVLALHDIGGMSISEVSAITGSARATIRQRLERARLALGRRMWRALTDKDQVQADWLKRLSPRLAERLEKGVQPLPQHDIIVVGTTAISTIDDLVIALWRSDHGSAEMEALIEVLLARSASSINGFRYLSVVEPSSTPPPREARHMMAWAAGKIGPHLRAAAWAIEDSKMMSAVAPVVNAFCFLGGVPFNMRIFDGLPLATAWLAQSGERLEPTDITAQVETMKRRLSS